MCSSPTMQTGSSLCSATGRMSKGTKQNTLVSCNPQTTCVECKTLTGFLLSQPCPFSLWGLWYVPNVQQNKTCFRFQQSRSLFVRPPPFSPSGPTPLISRPCIILIHRFSLFMWCSHHSLYFKILACNCHFY